MNKKELAEQIAEAEKLFNKHWDIVFLEDTDSNPYYSRPKPLIGYQAHKAIIAAIIEAMGKPESLQEIEKLATIEAEKIYAELNNHDCEKDFIDIRGTAISDFVDGAVWGAKQIEAMGVQPEGRSEGDLVASSSNTDDASLASHSCTDGNSIEQVYREALEKISLLYHTDRSCSLEAQGYNEQECQQIGIDDHAAQIAIQALTTNKKI